MYRIRKAMLSVSFELCASYLLKKTGKKAMLKRIDFVQSICEIKVKDILAKLESIPLFNKFDSHYSRVNNVYVIVYIAHKIRVEFLWQH